MPALGTLILLLWIAAFGGQPSALDHLDTLLTAGRYADAEKAARAAIEAAERAGDGDSLTAAGLLNKLVEARLRQGATGEETEQLVKRALALHERLAPGSAALAAALRNEAWLFEDRGNAEAAKARYARALDVIRVASGPAARETLMMQKDLAMAHRSTGDYVKARALLEEALTLRTHADPEHLDVAILRYNLGAVYWELGDYTAARDAFSVAATRFEQALGPDHPHVASALEGLAVVQVAFGNYAPARSTYLRVLRSREKTLPPQHPMTGRILVNLGDVLMAMGDNAGAKRALERGVGIWEAALGRDHPQLLIGLTNLAVVRERVGDLAGARRALTRAIAVREKANGPDDPELVVPLTQLANLHAEAGNLASAQPLYQRAAALAERTRGSDHPYVATSLLEQGQHLAAHGDLTRAAPLIERAAHIRETALGKNHPEVATAIDARARIAAAGGDNHRAIELALEAEAIARRHFQDTAAVLSESQALLYAEGRTRSQDLAIQSLVSTRAPDSRHIVSVWDAVVRSRALVLDEMAWRAHLASTVTDPAIARLADAAASARARLAQLFVRGQAATRTAEYARDISEARRAEEEAEERLAVASAPFRESRERRAAGLDDVLKGLPPRAALVSFIRYDEQIFAPARKAPRRAYAAFVVSPRGAPLLIRLGSATSIDQAVAALRRNIREETTAPPMGARKREAAFRSAAAALRRLIWDPMSSTLTGAERIMIVPDAALHLVDFATLPDKSGGFIVENRPTLHYASAERDLIERSEPRGTGLLAIGAPAFDRALSRSNGAGRGSLRSECAVRPGVTFAPLPDSGKEVDVVARLWSQQRDRAVTLRGTDASEANVRASAPGSRVLHVATHAFVLGEGCAPADLAGTTGDLLARSPLLGSGLVLAGAGKRDRERDADQDGILTAQEISAMNLAGLEWTVLSACDSGTGTLRAGEGVFGLRRALQVAGVRTVIMSLWPIEDRHARHWMEQLYTARLVRGEPTADAVRAANLDALHRRRKAGESTHPAYWAGFVATGDWR